MKILKMKNAYFYFLALGAIVAVTDAASIRNKIVKTINGTVQTVVDGLVDVALPLESSTSTARRVWITYERGQRTSVLSTMEISRIISTHMTPIYDFPAMSSVVTMATDEEIAAMMANSTIGPINVTDDPVRYPMVHSTKKIRRGQRHLQNQQETPYGIYLTQVDQLREATGLTGEGITVCVIDSGLDVTNPDFNTAGYNGTSLVFGSPWNTDSSGHGTHVTGIVAAADNTIGVVGAAPGANIYTVDVFADYGFAYASALVDAAYKCRDAGAKIISMSLGGPIPSDQENKLFSDLYNFNGILSIAAAGNDGNSDYGYPASYDTVLSVGAIDSSKTLAYFSTYNDRVDLVAPGVEVLSTLPSGSCEICYDTFQSTYGYVSGTSQATPYVSGIAALLWSSNVNLGANMIYDALINSAEDLGTSGRDVFYGNGLVAALAAYNSLTSSSGTAPPMSAPSTPPASSPITFPPIAPSTPPASSPVTDPPVTDPSPGSCVTASLAFRTDDFPFETFVKLTDVYSGIVLWYGGADSANTDYTLPPTCLNPNSCYLFEFYDTFGDGLCCLHGDGFFELSLDNVPVATGTSFGQYVYKYIGNGCQV
jgi:subtilisin family serine protease